MNGNDLTHALEWRYATKHFDKSRQIADSNWEVLEKALILSASSYGLQPWKFIIVQDAEIRKQLTPHSWNQPQIEECSHLVVFCVRKTINEEYINHYINTISEKRNISIDSLSGYMSMMKNSVSSMSNEAIINWNTRQVYIALGTLLTSAAVLKIDACPMEGINTDKYNEILKLTGSDYSVVCACPLGYRATNDSYANLAKVRFNADEVVEYI